MGPFVSDIHSDVGSDTISVIPHDNLCSGRLHKQQNSSEGGTMAFMQRLVIQTADPRSVCWAGGTLEGEVTLVLTDPTLIRGCLEVGPA
ncbi:hypothetical protein ACOMHN_033564 [Nucella lapillus]